MHEAVLLDLGNVVLGIDFRRVFTRWAEHAGVVEQVFYDRWAVDEAYKAHEIGEIDFTEYCGNLSRMFGVQLRESQWKDGWNALWTEPFHSVIELLPKVAERYSLYAFTNTNDTHVEFWRSRYADELAPFRHIFVSSEIGMRKPDEVAFVHVCEVIGADPENTLFLDDSKENVTGAQSIGVNAALTQSEAEVSEQLRTHLNSN